MVFHLQDFLDQLDQLYEREPRRLEAFLQSGLEKARRAEDTAAMLTIFNELMGYYRVTSRFEECEECIRKVQEFSRDMGIQRTVNYATILLNIATAYRMMGKMEPAEVYYQQVYECYKEEFTEPDYRMAAFYNNRSLLYLDTGRLLEAKQDLEKAMDLILKLDQSESEAAITHANIGNICFARQEIEEGTRHMEEARRIFEEKEGKKDAHYASVLSGLGEAYFRKDRLETSIEYYEKALREIRENYGENRDYEVTLRNLNLVQDTFARREAIRNRKIRGLELSRKYYEEYGRPMLHEKYPEYVSRIAAGLVGEGSECLGYDDEFSSDHDYGPGFCLWLTREDHEVIGEQLQKDYQNLPGEFMGFPVRNDTEHGAGRVGVMCTDDFYRKFTGYAVPPDRVRELEEWSRIDSTALCTVTNGEVFEDPLGEFTSRRDGFGRYPEKVRRFKLAGALGRMAQAGQYNYSRMRKRRDIGAMWLCLTEFINAAAEAAYLLNHMYIPIYKWKMRGMEKFEDMKNLKPMLQKLMAVHAEAKPEEAESQIEDICCLFVRELNRKGLSQSKEHFLEVHKMEMMKEAKNIDQEADFKALVDQVVALEWHQFQGVKNEGGRASCQDDHETFDIMRKSQFLTWDTETLESYRRDLTEAEDKGWNILSEKYARMMESTAPIQYEKLKKHLPVRSIERRKQEEYIIAKKVQWEEEFAGEYPALTGRGRAVHTWEDTPWNTSVETYARGELGSYSDETVLLYLEMIKKMEQNKENHARMVMEHMVRFYGYQSLDEAEQRYKLEERISP